jgi:hypothetical protein
VFGVDDDVRRIDREEYGMRGIERSFHSCMVWASRLYIRTVDKSHIVSFRFQGKGFLDVQFAGESLCLLACGDCEFLSWSALKFDHDLRAASCELRSSLSFHGHMYYSRVLSARTLSKHGSKWDRVH